MGRLGKVIRIGFEPMTYCLEGSCSIQLSYRTSGRKYSIIGVWNKKWKPAIGGMGIFPRFV